MHSTLVTTPSSLRLVLAAFGVVISPLVVVLVLVVVGVSLVRFACIVSIIPVATASVLVMALSSMPGAVLFVLIFLAVLPLLAFLTRL